MGPAVIVVLHPIPYMKIRILEVLEGVQVDALVFQGAPEPLDEHVVHPLAFAIHRDPDAVMLQEAGPGGADELTALVRVEDLRTAVAFDGFLESLDAECRVLRVRQPPGQHDALTDGGCEKLFREKLSGTRTTLPAREKLLAFARKGDVVVVWKLDRLGRSLRDLIDVVNSLQDRGVGLRSLQEAIDTTTPAGKLTFHIFAALAEFERDMIRERTRAGLAAAHKRGVAIGRPRALTPEQILIAKAMTADPSISIRQVAEQFGIHRSTLYRHLNARQKRSA